MKKLLLAAAVTTLSLSAAQAAPTLYGKVNVSVDSYDDGKDDKVEVNSNASRLGVKGEEKLTEKLSAVYQAEWEIDVDGGDDVFKKRNIFAGLKWANLGTLKQVSWIRHLKMRLVDTVTCLMTTHMPTSKK